MFMNRKKEKDRTEEKEKPPVPPKRGIFGFGSHHDKEKPQPQPRTEHVEHSNVPSTYTQNNTATGNGHATNGHRDQLVINMDTKESGMPSRVLASPKDFNIQGLTLPALAVVQVKQRKLKIQKSITGDFGFSIRRVQVPSGRGDLRTIVFAEPTDIRPGPPRPDDIKNGLLPGDQLVEVDGRRVDSMSREELQDAVRNAGQTIDLVVRAVPELAEFCDRRRGARDGGDQLMLTNVNTNLHEDVPEDERYWLLHKGGYTLARLCEILPDGRARIVVAGREMIVDSTDVDRANPSHLDRIGDISGLRYLNETSTVHLLRQRFGSNLLYSNAGSQSLVCLTSIDGEPSSHHRLVSLFKGCRRGQMPSHIYATAQLVYRNLQMTGQSQSVLLTGVTGSGKSTQLRHLLNYLCVVAGWTKSLPYEKLVPALGVLEAFGHAATNLHRDSTRYVQLFSLGFDKAAALRSARVQACLLESDRVMRRPEDESTFHVFYYMWEGVSGALRDHLQLDSIEHPSFKPFTKQQERQNAAEAWSRLMEALAELGFCESRRSAVCSVLAAVLHLHAAGATPGSAQRAHFLRATHAQTAASLLGVGVEELAQAVFRGKTSVSSQHSSVSNAGINRFALTSRGADGPEALIAFAAGLYQELFLILVEHINKALAANSACSWITILDYPGSNFHAEWADISKGAFGLNELVYNYVNEKVAELFHDVSFTDLQEVYSREQVDVEVEMPIVSPHALNRLLDQKQQLLACTDIERRSEERRGLLAILEEESMFPGATDESLLERIFVHLGDETRLIRRAPHPRQFVIAHAMDSHPTTYDVKGWVKQAQPCEGAASARPLLALSKNGGICLLFAFSTLPAETSKLRRLTQAAQLELSSRRSAGGFLANINGQIDYVFSSLRRSPRSHFVHCVQPTAAMRSAHDIIDVPFVRSQLRSILLIDSVRANNRGFPERVSFRDFRRRFGCLAEDGDTSIDDALDDRAAVARILDRMDIHQHRYRLGISQVLLASDVLCELEDRRELSLSGLVAAFQRECRRHIAAKWLQKRRILETAIRCIQKNGRSYMKVREWPWWRLYTKVTPLLAVARTDTEHREWDQRVRQLEQQLNDLRIQKTRLEGRTAEAEEELARETQTARELSVALDRETQTRIQLERRLQQWRDGGMDDDKISRVSSVARMEATDERTAELKNEVARAKENEEQLRAKTQRAVAQLQDVETELSRVRARNDTLEKKQQRFDADLQVIEVQMQEARQSKEKAEKEKEDHLITATRKATELQSLKTENSELRVAISRLRREADERSEGSNGSIELVAVQKARREMEGKIKEQEEEMDDLAGQNQLLQQTVTRLEMGAERLRADLSRESAARETEMDELRGQYQRRLRTLEDQLADVQESNSSLIKENRVLEVRARNNDMSSQSLEFSGGHYRRELRKALALLVDTQAILAHERESAPSQALIRQLREQLEDAEAAKLSALKGRHGLDNELDEMRVQLEQALAAKSAAEEKALSLLKEKNSGLALIEEKDEQLQSLLKKYKAAVQQSHIDHIAIADYVEQIADLEKWKQKLSEESYEAQSQLEHMKQHTVEKHKLLLLEQKCRDTESRLDLETAQKNRLESMVAKLRDEVDGLQDQLTESATSKEKELEHGRKIRKEMSQLQETIEELRKRDIDAAHKNKSARSDMDHLEDQNKILTAELKMANRRIESLQTALSEGLGDDEESDDDRDEHSAGMNIL